MRISKDTNSATMELHPGATRNREQLAQTTPVRRPDAAIGLINAALLGSALWFGGYLLVGLFI